MHGTHGTSRRKRIVRAELALAAGALSAFGLLAIARGHGAWLALGVWMVGLGANYVPLALEAQRLSRGTALSDGVAMLDLPRELRRATLAQLWLAVPFAVLLGALGRAADRRSAASSPARRSDDGRRRGAERRTQGPDVVRSGPAPGRKCARTEDRRAGSVAATADHWRELLMAAKFVVYADSGGKYRWKLEAGNGQTIASSGESFASKSNAREAAENVKARAAEASITEE